MGNANERADAGGEALHADAVRALRARNAFAQLREEWADNLRPGDAHRLPFTWTAGGHLSSGWHCIKRGTLTLLLFKGHVRKHLWVRLLFDTSETERPRLLHAVTPRNPFDVSDLWEEPLVDGFGWKATGYLYQRGAFGRVVDAATVWKARPMLRAGMRDEVRKADRREALTAIHAWAMGRNDARVRQAWPLARVQAIIDRCGWAVAPHHRRKVDGLTWPE